MLSSPTPPLLVKLPLVTRLVDAEALPASASPAVTAATIIGKDFRIDLFLKLSPTQIGFCRHIG